MLNFYYIREPNDRYGKEFCHFELEINKEMKADFSLWKISKKIVELQNVA